MRTFWPPSCHLIGKDILRFHAVYWPALLMAAGLELPEHVFVHGFLLMDGEKMSKSLGNVLDPFAVIERFGADALRFYLLRDVPLRPGRLGLDGRVRAALRERAGQRPRQPRQPHDRDDRALPRGQARSPARSIRRCAATSPGCPSASRSCLDRAELTLALEEIWQRVRRLNRYVEEQAPWKLAKDGARAAELDRVLRTLAEGLRTVGVLLWPYLPASCERLLAALGTPGLSLAGAAIGTGGIEHVSTLEPLFPKDASAGAGA